MYDDNRHRRTRSVESDDRVAPTAARDLLSAAALLVLIVVLAYRPSLNAEFVHLDDFQYVVDNELVRQPGLMGVRRVFAEVFHPSTVDGYYQPLTMVSLMVDAALSGTTIRSVNPYIFHLTNVLLHAATSVLVFLWIRTFLGGLFLPFLVALYFALHPAHVESVAWVSQRKTLLATFLAIAALIAYVEFVRYRGRWWLAASVLLYFMATLAKPTTVLLPLVLPLIDLWPLGRRPRAALREKWPFAPVLLVMGYIAWASQAAAGAGVGVPNLSAANALGRWIDLLSYNFVLYVGNLLWPLHLSPYRALPDDLSLSNPAVLFSVIATAAILIAWIASWRFSTPLFAGLTAFGLMVAPTVGAIRFMGSCVADRFLYLPMFFLVLPLAYALFFAKRRFTRPAAFGFPLVLLALPLWILTRAQQGVWQDSKALWTHVALADPKLGKAHANLALIALEEEDFATALERAQKAHALDPENSANLHVLGRAYVRRGQPAKAVSLIEQALAKGLGPNQASGFVALGEARLCLGDEAGAFSAAQDAGALGYAADRAYAEFGNAAYRFAGNYELAERMFRRAVEAAPDDPDHHWKLAAALEYRGRYGESLHQCEQAMRLSEQQAREVPDTVRQAVERLRAARRQSTGRGGLAPMKPNDTVALTRAQVREIDRRAIEEYGVPGIVLMENAGRNAAQFILSLPPSTGPIAIVCGGGNNGGDGFVIARHLTNAGLEVGLFLACDPARLSGGAGVNYGVVEKMALRSYPFDTPERIGAARPALHSCTVIVDALLGTGFSGSIRPPLDLVSDAVNQAPRAIIVAVDVPSGLDCDTGRPASPTIRAHHTVTFVAQKIGFSAPGAEAYTGAVVVADIGSPAALIQTVVRESNSP